MLKVNNQQPIIKMNTTKITQMNTNNLPKDFLHPGGFVEDYMNFVNETAVCPQPMFALASALALAGTLYGQHVQTEDGQRTNIFCMTVGYTSCGKGHPLTMLARTLDECGATNLRLGQVTSDSAIEWALKQQSRFCFLIDEAGHYFGNVGDPNAKGTAAHAIKPALLELWSAAGGTWKGKQRVPRDGKEMPPLVIENPHLCLYATTQPQILFDTLSRNDLRDGWLPRNLFFISETRPKPVALPKRDIPNAIRYEVLRWKNPPARLATIPTSPGARTVFDAFSNEVYQKMLTADKSGDETNYLYGKSLENATRIALILAVSRAGLDATIEECDATYATELVYYLTNTLISATQQHINESAIEEAKNRILEVIRKAGPLGATKSLVTRKTQYLRRALRDEYLDDLVTGGELVVTEIAKGGECYKLSGLV